MTIAIDSHPGPALQASAVQTSVGPVRRLLRAAWNALESAGARRAALYLETFAATKMRSDPAFARQLREAIGSGTDAVSTPRT